MYMFICIYTHTSNRALMSRVMASNQDISAAPGPYVSKR